MYSYTLCIHHITGQALKRLKFGACDCDFLVWRNLCRSTSAVPPHFVFCSLVQKTAQLFCLCTTSKESKGSILSRISTSIRIPVRTDAPYLLLVVQGDYSGRSFGWDTKTEVPYQKEWYNIAFLLYLFKSPRGRARPKWWYDAVVHNQCWRLRINAIEPSKQTWKWITFSPCIWK